MTRRIILLTFLTFLYFSDNNVIAQTYSVESFQGVKTKIKLYYKPFSGILRITCLKDTFFINNYMALEDVRLLNNKFLKITYVERAGSNMDRMNVLLLCIDSSKLFESMHIMSFNTFETGDEHMLFTVKIKFAGNNKGTYKIEAIIHDESKSKMHPEKNHSYNKKTSLSFDSSHNVFYNSRKDESGYLVDNPWEKVPVKHFISGTFPAIIIDKDEYYYMNGTWCEKGIDYDFVRDSYR
jgi:hypothetical protein